jgi:nitroreductase
MDSVENPMIEPILSRRSIRKYTDEPVSEEQITKLLEAGMAAPSASNKKPWHFVVVTERETLDKLSHYGSHWDMLRDAPLSIVVCGDPGISDRYWVQDCSAATENILLAVTMIGLGAVWLGCHPNPERVDPTKELLGIEDPVTPLAVLAIGHPAEEKEARTQYDDARVHRDRW